MPLDAENIDWVTRHYASAANAIVGRVNALFTGWASAAVLTWLETALAPSITPYGSALGLLAVVFSLIAFARWRLATEAERVRDNIRSDYYDGR